MSASRRRTLIQDLAKILAAHPAQEWRDLILTLEDESLRRQTIAALKTLIPLAKPNSTRKHQAKPSKGSAAVLRDLHLNEPEKAEVLQSLWIQLQKRTFLPTAKSLREFAEICGLKETLHRKREQAISQLVRYLANVSLQEINRALSQNISSQRDFGAEYERWVDLILGRKSKGTVEGPKLNSSG